MNTPSAHSSANAASSLNPLAIPADEVPATLSSPPPKNLGVFDQVSLWANLGITLTIPVAAAFVLQPGGPALSLVAAIVAVVVGAVIGSAMLTCAAVPGAATGAPAMVVLRGLLGFRGSAVPTILNLVQNVGWATIEILIIATVAGQLTDPRFKWVFVVAAGALGTLLTLRPLGFVRILRRYAVWVVIVATAYLLIAELRHGFPAMTTGSWSGFWLAADVVIALPISWAPLAADYTRHSVSTGATVVGTMAGYASACSVFFLLGLFALGALTVHDGDVIGSLIALPVGGVAVAILAIDEADKAFANVYSTATSIQNLRPHWDRRILGVVVGAIATLLALTLDLTQYEDFLFLIGSVFVPLYGALAASFFLRRKGSSWDMGRTARLRPGMVVAWIAGFVVYQLINPGGIGWWRDLWTTLDGNWVTPSWLSASVTSFVVAAALAGALGTFTAARSDKEQTRTESV